MKETRENITEKSHGGSPSTQVAVDGQDLRETTLKKGPWTPAEDAILIDFVTKNGEGNWNSVHKVSGLRRCGKSCRLRWANHLRPDLKKGAFTPDEERLIIELHARMGNKWARMAAELPGRTDNEIKNFWNTRIKRLQRTGMPIYPLDICLKVLHESQNGQSINSLQLSEMQCANSIPTVGSNVPEMELRDLEYNRGLQFFSQLHPSPSSMTKHWTIPTQSYCFNMPRIYLPGHLQESQTSLPGLNANNELWVGIFPHNHAYIDGLSSSSKPINGAIKFELPSFQYSDSQYPWGAPRSPLPSFGIADTLVESPPTEQTPSNCVSPRSSGLLEAVVYESQTLKRTERILGQNNKDTPIGVKSISPNSFKTEWEGHGDLNSSLANSPISAISDCTPGSKNSSEYQSTGLHADPEAGD